MGGLVGLRLKTFSSPDSVPQGTTDPEQDGTQATTSLQFSYCRTVPTQGPPRGTDGPLPNLVPSQHVEEGGGGVEGPDLQAVVHMDHQPAGGQSGGRAGVAQLSKGGDTSQ